MSVKVENFGCRLNALEGDVAQAAAKTAGLDKTIIINGCAVTGEALRQARQAARRAKRAGPDHEIIVTGCAAQTDAPTSPPCRKLTACSAMKKSSTPRLMLRAPPWR